MKILITGASGLIGSHLQPFLISQGHSIVPISVRSLASGKNAEKLQRLLEESQFDAVVHLAGENVAERWTEEKMARIRESRVKGTELLSTILAKLSHKPKVLVSASAIGYYGNREHEALNEQSPKGAGFLADVCQEWEQATQAAKDAGIRVVNMRIGVVMSNRGGALAKMLLPFQLGAGGEIGSGEQFMSWVDIDDVVGAIYQAINTESLQGPVNATAPHPVTNKEFTKTLGKVLYRPTLIPIPSFALRLLFGSMADEMLIAGQKVLPIKLNNSGYKFKYADLESSLQHALSK